MVCNCYSQKERCFPLFTNLFILCDNHGSLKCVCVWFVPLFITGNLIFFFF